MASKKKLIDEIAEEPHFTFTPFETWQLRRTTPLESNKLLLLLLGSNCNYTEGAALSYESVHPLITILYVVSL